MNLTELRDRLSNNASGIAALLDGAGTAESDWKPGEDRWLLVEIVDHLADEEAEDFCVRLR